MDDETKYGISKSELTARRKELGVWLKELREKAGLSQTALASRVKADYYSFVSQVETGLTPLPPSKIEAWADALQVDHRTFAISVLRAANPVLYRMLYGQASPDEPLPSPQFSQTTAHSNGVNGADTGPSEPANEKLEELKARLARLEAIVLLKHSQHA
jgi:transcriptional regulator with XRE-family HTH domain